MSLDPFATRVHTPVPTAGVTAGTGLTSLTFSLPGVLVVSESPRVRPLRTMNVFDFSATLITPGTTTSTVNLLKNGIIVASISLLSGVTFETAHIPPVLFLQHVDTFSFSVTVAGTAASDLGGQIGYSA